MQRAPATQGSSRQACMHLAYNPHAVGWKLSREPPPTALARRWEKVEATMPQHVLCRCPRPQHAAHQPTLQRAPVLPTLPPAAELVQPPCPRRPAECWNRSRHEHGIFVSGYEDRSSMKGCSLGMILRCVRAARASARDICSTLPARRDDRSRFARSVGRMYPLTSNALRV